MTALGLFVWFSFKLKEILKILIFFLNTARDILELIP